MAVDLPTIPKGQRPAHTGAARTFYTAQTALMLDWDKYCEAGHTTFAKHQNVAAECFKSERDLNERMKGQCAFISHVWLSSAEPDPEGLQFDIIRKVCAHYNIKYVWYDYTCLPQGERSPEQRKYFDSMLPQIGRLAQEYRYVCLWDEGTGVWSTACNDVESDHEKGTRGGRRRRRPFIKRGWCVLELLAGVLADGILVTGRCTASRPRGDREVPVTKRVNNFVLMVYSDLKLNYEGKDSVGQVSAQLMSRDIETTNEADLQIVAENIAEHCPNQGVPLGANFEDEERLGAGVVARRMTKKRPPPKKR